MRNVALALVLLALTLVVSCGASNVTSTPADASTADGTASSLGVPTDSGVDARGDTGEQTSPESGTVDGGSCGVGCPEGYVCGFLESAGCSAVGTCVPMGAVCYIATGDFCSCDGRSIFTVCGTNGLPQGYETAPYDHAGPCEFDSGAD